jgi:formyltetrahydrofolate deformylase
VRILGYPRPSVPESPSPALATLLVSCPDRKGIVAALAQTLYGHGANILQADQYTDAAAGQFFQRIVADLSEIHTDRVTVERALAELATRFSMSCRLRWSAPRKNVALFVSRYEHCLHDLLVRHRLGELACEIRLVVANHPDLERVARQYDVPFHHVPVAPDDKEAAEAGALALLEKNAIDLLVFARYMQIVSSDFVRRYAARIINIHHSFLPAFVGPRPYEQAQRRGVKLIGATAHYVTEDLDEGPIIEQDVARISHRDSVEDLVRKGRDLEKVVLARAVRLDLEDRVLVYGNKTVVFD